MTRARALKQIIRDRAAKTGERYTTARRHVLAQQTRPSAPQPPSTRAPEHPSTRALHHPSTSALQHPSTSAPQHFSTSAPVKKAPLSDARITEKTGHGFAYWFGVLDRFGAVEKGHTQAARHLYADHKVPGWYAQGITVAYERARGVRAVNQRVDGTYEMSASKVIDAKTADIVQMISSKRLRRSWLIDVDPELARALAVALDSKQSKGFAIRADGLGTFRYKWGTTTVQWYVAPTATGKRSVVVANGKLAGAEMLEERRKLWRTALKALAAQFAD